MGACQERKQGVRERREGVKLGGSKFGAGLLNPTRVKSLKASRLPAPGVLRDDLSRETIAQKSLLVLTAHHQHVHRVF